MLQSTAGLEIDFRLTNNESKKLGESSNLDLDSLGYTKTLNKETVRVPSPSNNSFVNESEPELPPSSKEVEPIREPEQHHESRKSVPHNKSGAYVYNENLMKTFESSEFEQQSPEQLPGMIFGLGQQPNGRASIPGS